MVCGRRRLPNLLPSLLKGACPFFLLLCPSIFTTSSQQQFVFLLAVPLTCELSQDRRAKYWPIRGTRNGCMPIVAVRSSGMVLTSAIRPLALKVQVVRQPYRDAASVASVTLKEPPILPFSRPPASPRWGGTVAPDFFFVPWALAWWVRFGGHSRSSLPSSERGIRNPRTDVPPSNAGGGG
ncbi:hypothetical protein GQ53DRAFT_230716 [Thozetella sp. PMI_491]|nr:hypothetical protein GQ53DRAFT_230716 [Thozetella sp. PMI_491]